MVSQNIDLESLVENPTTKLSDLRSKLVAVGVENPDAIISYIGLHLTQEQESDLLYYAQAMVRQERTEDFSKLWLALELSNRFSRKPNYLEAILFALNFNLEFTHFNSPNLTDYESLVGFYLNGSQVLKNMGIKKLKSRNNRLIKQILSLYHNKGPQINTILQQFQDSQLSEQYLFAFLHSPNNRFFEVVEFVEKKKLDYQSAYLILGYQSLDLNVLDKLIDEQSSLDDVVMATLALSFRLHQVEESLARGNDLVQIYNELKLDNDVIKKLVHITRITKTPVSLQQIYDIFTKNPEQLNKILDSGAKPDEIPVLISYLQNSRDAITAFLKSRKSDVHAHQADIYIRMYNKYSELVRHYLQRFDSRELNRFQWVLAQDPEILRVCMEYNVPMNRIWYRIPPILEFVSLDREGFRRAIQRNVPFVFWGHYISTHQQHKEGLDYCEQIELPISEEFFSIARTYERLKEVYHTYLGTREQHSEISHREVILLDRLISYDPHRMAEFAKKDLSLADVPFIIDLNEDNYQILIDIDDASIDTVIEQFKQKDDDMRRKNKFNTLRTEYTKECNYYNFHSPEESIPRIIGFLDDYSSLELRIFASELNGYLSNLTEPIKIDIIRFFLDMVDYDDNYIERKKSQIRRYQELLNQVSIRLFDAVSTIIESELESDYKKRIVVIYPGSVEKMDLKRQAGINSVQGHYEGSICFAETEHITWFEQRTILGTEFQTDLHDFNLPRELGIVGGGRYSNWGLMLEDAFSDSALTEGYEYCAVVPAQYQINRWPWINHKTTYNTYSKLPIQQGYRLVHLPHEIEINGILVDMLWVKKVDQGLRSRLFV